MNIMLYKTISSKLWSLGL